MIFVHILPSPLLPKGIWSIQNTSYLPPLSITRLVLLLPLNYHVYSGTRLKFPALYTILHVISALIVLSHFFAFSLLASENFSDFYLPAIPVIDVVDDGSGQDGSGRTDDLNLDELLSNHVSDEIKEYDVIWILLTLSLFSIGLHIVILLHVRSTAPTNDAMKRKFEEAVVLNSGKKRLGYWVYNQYRRENNHNLEDDDSRSDDNDHDSPLFGMDAGGGTGRSTGRGALSPLRGRSRSSSGDLSAASLSDLESGLSLETDAFISHDVFRSSLDDDEMPRRRSTRRRTASDAKLGSLLGLDRCFSSGYDGK